VFFKVWALSRKGHVDTLLALLPYEVWLQIAQYLMGNSGFSNMRYSRKRALQDMASFEEMRLGQLELGS